MYKKTKIFLLFISLQLFIGFGRGVQAQNNALVLSGAFVNINGGTFANPVYVVVNNGLPAAILRNSGHIISEGEGNYVKWITSAATNNFVFPFGYSTTTYLPATVHKTSAGATTITMSTWRTAASGNLPWANLVLTMNSNATGLPAAVSSVIDRWWQAMEPVGFTGTLDVTYRGVENTTTVAPLGNFNGQEWIDASSVWGFAGTGLGVGVTGAGTGTVTGITMNPYGATFSSPYVLSAAEYPLPIELVSFTAQCNSGNVKVEWKDASETNVTSIELQRSTDLNVWNTIYTASPSNTHSLTTYNYSYSDNSSSTIYYRLKTNNNDGGYELSNTIYCLPCNGSNSSISTYYFDNNINIISHFDSDSKVNYTLYDAFGKKVMSGEYEASQGTSLFSLPVYELSNGIYFLNALNQNTFYNQKIIITK